MELNLMEVIPLNIQDTEHGALKNQGLGLLHWRAQINEQFWPKSFKFSLSYTNI